MKLVAVIALLGLFLAVANAAYTIMTYSDSGCTQPVGFWQTTDACIDKKRSTTQTCYGAPDGSPNWLQVFECAGADVMPTVAPPDGWLVLKYTTNSACNFSTYEITAVNQSIAPVLVLLPGMGHAMAVTVNTTCGDGVLSVSLFNAQIPLALSGELTFNVCSTLGDRTALYDTPCTFVPTVVPVAPVANVPVAPPMTAPMTAPMADTPVAAPMMAPVGSAPTKVPSSTPVKKASDAISSAVGILSAVITLTAILV